LIAFLTQDIGLALHHDAENNGASFDVIFTCGFAQVPNTIRPVTSKGVPRGHML
jgi:hypothetical protein